MNKKFRGLSVKILGGKGALTAYIAIFVVLASRIALTKVYPLPYDEGFHFGLIQLYTHHLNPLLASQPAGADSYGAVARDPSYLYHYLMSFPLRFISLFTHVTIRQIVALRMIDICFGITSLLLVRKLASRLGASASFANFTVLALAITPVFYDLSGQINYDNMLLPLTLVALLESWTITTTIKHGQVSLARLGRLAALLLAASLVKYTFLPIMAAIFVYLATCIAYRRYKKSLGWNGRLKSWSAVLAIVLVVASGLLWTQRYGVNLVTYHTPDPQCGVVLTVQDCSHYGPWYRNYLLQKSYATHPVNSLELVSFSKSWLRSMYYGVYSIVHVQSQTVVFTPITIVRVAAKFMLAGSLLYGLVRWRRAKGSNIAWVLLGLVGATYSVSLWAQNFSDYHHLGAMVAIQGRYLILVLPIIYATMARMYSLLIQDLVSARLRLLVAEYYAAATVMCLEAYEIARKPRDFQHVMYSIGQAMHFRTYP